MNEKFYLDYKKYAGEEWKFSKGVLHLLKSYSLRFVYIGRKAETSRSRLMSGIYRLMLKHYKEKYNVTVPFEYTGAGLSLGYAHDIIVNGQVKMGEQVCLYKGVLIGSIRTGVKAGVPQIGNGVVVCNNATIVGNIKIGNDVLIAPGAFVNFDVPDHSLVIGNPGVIYYKENATEGYMFD